MKAAIAITAAGLMSFGIVSTASAFHLVPENMNFTAHGNTSATKGGVTLPCVATFQGNINATGVGNVTGGSFKDVKGGQGCALVSLTNLPWVVTATGRKTVMLSGVEFSTPIGSCGPGDIKGQVKNGNLVLTAVPLAPNCTVSAKVKTTPTVSIVKH